MAGETHTIKLDKEKSTGWELKEDGFYYYKNPIDVKKLSDELVVTINPGDDDSDDFNVIVVEEATRVNDNGEADWDAKSVNSEKFGLNNNDEGGAN